jgi:hypothetical protein
VGTYAWVRTKAGCAGGRTTARLCSAAKAAANIALWCVLLSDATSREIVGARRERRHER